MKHCAVRSFALVMAVALVLVGCRKPDATTEPAASRAASPRTVESSTSAGGPTASTGAGDQLAATPLAGFRSHVRTGEGVDAANGKRWIGCTSPTTTSCRT